MKVEPTAADLVDIARATILSDIVPALPGDPRYAALMACLLYTSDAADE